MGRYDFISCQLQRDTDLGVREGLLALTERDRDRDGETDRDKKNSNSKTLFYKDCSLNLVKTLTTRDAEM